MDKPIKSTYSSKSFLKFFIPSLLGVLIFMTPIMHNGEITIPIAIISKLLQNSISAYIPTILTILIVLSTAVSILVKVLQPSFIVNHKYLNSLFNLSPLWFVCRILGAVIITMVLLQVGPEFIWSPDTGGMLVNDLLPVLFAVFLFAGLFLPLLLNFGLLELFGSLLSKVMRPIFTLPGRSSIDCITSWLGDGTIGVLLTGKQYEEGHYTKREAAVISTTFSAVSITFSLVIISQVGLGHLFVPFYLTVTIAGIVAAIVIPRIPPLNKKSDTYIDGSKKVEKEIIPEGYSPLKWGIKNAVDRAEQNTSITEFFVEGIKNVLDMWIGVLPVVVAMGTIALIIATYTPVFKVLGAPFIPFLNLLQIPEATAASQTILVGFADMFLPSVLASGISSELTRFVIAALSVTQLVYMSEIGGLLLGSKIPVNLKDLILIFLTRTIVTLPVISLCAHLLFKFV